MGMVGQGRFTDDAKDLRRRGRRAHSNLQKLLRYICERGFEHHVAANMSSVASAVREATSRYLGWNVHYHE